MLSVPHQSHRRLSKPKPDQRETKIERFQVQFDTFFGRSGDGVGARHRNMFLNKLALKE